MAHWCFHCWRCRSAQQVPRLGDPVELSNPIQPRHATAPASKSRPQRAKFRSAGVFRTLKKSSTGTPPQRTQGDVVELVELLGSAVFQYLVNIKKTPTSQDDARSVVEPMDGNGGGRRGIERSARVKQDAKAEHSYSSNSTTSLISPPTFPRVPWSGEPKGTLLN